MTAAPITVAVVGHTNTGKTSLLRTLTRDVTFGEVSPRPAVTRHVEGTALLVDGQPVVELYDTPGLEDSISLLDHLDGLARAADARRPDWVQTLERFLRSPEAHGRFVQEAKAIRQVLKSDIALYVIDVRDRVLGKHRDELEILSRCARPVVPVLNFVASPEAKTAAWREHLARVNMHVVVEFDTVVLDEQGERRLFEKMQTVLDTHHAALQSLIDDRARYRRRLIAAAAGLLADLLIDAAAFVVLVPMNDREKTEAAMQSMQRTVRVREERCLRQLLELFAFREDDGRLEDLPIEGGQWGMDLFSPEAMKEFGVKTGSAVAAGATAGAMAGLALEAMTAGLSLGAFTATGAAIGALYQTGRLYGRRLVDRARGLSELRCNESTLRLLMERQLALVRALLHRGHAAMEPVRVGGVSPADASGGATGKPGVPVLPGGATGKRGLPTGRGLPVPDRGDRLPPELLKARTNPRWSTLTAAARDREAPAGRESMPAQLAAAPDLAREAAQQSLAERLQKSLA